MNRIVQLVVVVFSILSVTILSVLPSVALVHMDTESVEMALRYGMIHQNQGFASLLGANWMEGQNGSLLNIYTPFMLLATRVAKGGFPTEPTPDAIQAAKKKYSRMIREFTDKEYPTKVKFAVSLMGDTPKFASQTQAFIKGFAHGRAVTLVPSKEFRQSSSSVKPSTGVPGKFEAVNSYYFDFPALADLSQYELILETPQQVSIRFRINNQRIY